MREARLPGGNTTGAVRIGDVVHKRASPWTPTVHALLRHLEDAGFDAAPRALGFDDQGREMLTFLPGETIGDRNPWPGWALADSATRTRLRTTRWSTATGWSVSSTGISPVHRPGSGIWRSRHCPGCHWRHRPMACR